MGGKATTLGRFGQGEALRLLALGRGATLGVAVVLAVAVTLGCVLASGQPAVAVSFLYVVPIGLLGAAFGRWGGYGAAAAGVGCALALALWGVLPGGAVGHAARAVTFAAVGTLVGCLADERSRVVADSKWFEMSNEMLVEASLEGYFTRLTARWEECLGWSREELMARPFRELIHPDDLAATNVHADSLEARPGEVTNFENRYLAKDGSWRWLLWSARSDHRRKYAVAKDITERKRLETENLVLLEQVAALARTDALTGLPNRRAWDEELERAVAAWGRHGRPFALAMVDLDAFKRFNDARGHGAGDALLREAAEGWREVLRATDFLARYGGEEFALLLPDCPGAEAVMLLERLRGATPQGQTCSVGIAWAEQGDGAADLVKRADAALYEAKRRGRDRVVAAG